MNALKSGDVRDLTVGERVWLIRQIVEAIKQVAHVQAPRTPVATSGLFENLRRADELLDELQVRDLPVPPENADELLRELNHANIEYPVDCQPHHHAGYFWWKIVMWAGLAHFTSMVTKDKFESQWRIVEALPNTLNNIQEIIAKIKAKADGC
jgi:FAD/FMN-containing dehydrogenase